MRSRFAAVFSGLMLVAGCGTSDYESKFEASLTALRNEVPFESLWQKPVSIPLPAAEKRLILKVRIPRLFNTKTGESYALDQNTPDPRNQEVAIYPDRLWPSFLHFGTHLRTYEVTLNFKNRTGKSERSSIRCFLSVMPRTEEVDSHGILSKRITEKLKGAFNKNTVLTAQQTKSDRTLKSGVGEWIALSVPMPNGKTREIEKIEATGNIQLPHYMELGKPATQNKTTLATCLLYIVRSEEETIILSWLLPVDLAAQKNIAVPEVNVQTTSLPVARAMAGTVEITELPPESPVATD